MRSLPTIDIEHPNDPGRTLRINAADFDARIHRRAGAAAHAARPARRGNPRKRSDSAPARSDERQE